MQRYRVNYPLLIGLVGGVVLLIGGGLGLYFFQLSRNAGRLLDRAQEMRDEGNLVKAISLMHDYVSIRDDDSGALKTLANDYADLINDPTILQDPLGREKLQRAMAQLKVFVREQPDNVELKRRLVDLLLTANPKEALDHINQLLNRSPGDTELELLKSQCLFATSDPKRIQHAYRLVGYSQETGEFDATKAVAPEDVTTYVRLAVALRQDEEDNEQARRVVEQLVDANPEDGMAYLGRGRYLQQAGDTEDGNADVEKAYEISPEDPEVMVAYARMLSEDEEKLDEAIEILEKCAEEHPEHLPAYQNLAAVEVKRKDYEAAIKRYDQGIAVLPEARLPMLQFYKARLQIESEDGEGARETIQQMRDGKAILPPFIDYLDARLAMFEGEYLKALREYQRLKAFMENVPDMRSELQFFLAFCYEKLGQYEKALDAYNVTLQTDPLNALAGYGKTRMEQRVGRSVRDYGEASIYEALSKELAKPREDQNWGAFDVLIDQYVERLNLGEAMKMIIEGEVLMRRKEYQQAREKLIGAYKKDPDNLGVRRAAVKLFALDPDQGPIKALKLLDKVVADFGDLPILRLERADLLVRINDEDVSEQLLELTDDIDDWQRNDQVQLWSGLAQRFEQLRDREKRQLCLNRVVELSPTDLQTLERLFMMARQSDDEAGMADTQKRIRDILGTRDDPVYQFTEAHVAVSRYRTQKQDEEYLAEADEAIRKALDERPKWHQLHLLRAEVALLRGDETAALKSFDLAAEYGPPTAVSLLQHVKLLVKRGRYKDAVIAAERAPSELRVALLGRDYAAALLASGDAEEAISVADQIAQRLETDGSTRLWHGKFLVQASNSSTVGNDPDVRERLAERAGESLEAAVDLTPGNSDAWLTWISYLASQGRRMEAEEELHRAELQLVEDQPQLVFARCYEIIGRWIDAEQRYVAALEDAIPSERPRAARLLASFYAGNFYPGRDKVARATPLVNEVLRLVADGELDPNNTNARWARTAAARLLAGSGEYKKLLDAERLLASNAIDGRLAVEDQLLMAEILASRPEPLSRIKATALYEKLQETQRLSTKAELELGGLYFSLGEWRKCREQMINAIARYPKDPTVRVRYLNMLLERGGPTEIDEAVRQLKRLVKLAPNDLTTRELVARVAIKRGKKREAINALRGMLPRRVNEIKPDQFPLVIRVAGLLNEIEAPEQAEPLFKIVAELGGVREKAEHATFVGRAIDAERGMQMLDDLSSDLNKVEQIQRGLTILRVAADEREDQAEAVATTLEGWLTSALREDPELTPLLMQKAELSDLKREYEEAAAIYRDLLAGDELRGTNRAVVLNNFAYLLALTDDSSEAVAEAKECVDEAVDLLGPGTDILDTRAIVAIADKRYEDAVSDLELAVIDGPTPEKYFHKAVAHLMAGQTDEAINAWKEAVERGLSEEAVSRLERERYLRVRDELEGLGMRSASL